MARATISASPQSSQVQRLPALTHSGKKPTRGSPYVLPQAYPRPMKSQNSASPVSVAYSVIPSSTRVWPWKCGELMNSAVPASKATLCNAEPRSSFPAASRASSQPSVRYTCTRA